MPAKSKANDDKKEPKTTETTKVADKAPEEKGKSRHDRRSTRLFKIRFFYKRRGKY